MEDTMYEGFPQNIPTHSENALDFSLPASDALLKNRNNSWIQLAGHQGAFAPASPQTIWKKRVGKTDSEVQAYRCLMADQCCDIIPVFYREVEYKGDFFIEIENLINKFVCPSMMDVKMGFRTFQESEVRNPVMRKDLYERMFKLDPKSLTEQERKDEAVTKLRYMQFRERESSTSNLGFRLEAIKISGQPLMNTCLRKLKAPTDVLSYMQTFVQSHEDVRQQFLARLRYMRESFISSDFFQRHEVIGSSLLFLYDHTGGAGVWMIDFAKTVPVDNIILNHTSEWELGNHEDGYLAGLNNLINMFESLNS